MSSNKVYISQSRIPHAGRGLFIARPVSSGAIIVKIERPPICIVADHELENTCDECFAHVSAKGRSVAREVEFRGCGGCAVVWYCSRECKDKAWNAHHKYECEVYKAIKRGESKTSYNIESIRCQRLRCIIRLLVLRKFNVLSKEDFESFEALARGERDMNDAAMQYVRDIIRKHDLTDLSDEKVDHLIAALCNNECHLDAPRLLTTTELAEFPILEEVEPLTLGICLEPTNYSMINHSCAPNAYWTFSGRELQVRAEREIAADEEITISYIPRGHYYERMEKLASWGIKCKCEICLQGPIEPVGRLRGRVDMLLDDRPGLDIPHKHRIQLTQDLICDLRAAGYGWGAWPYKWLFYRYYHSLKLTGDYWEMVRTMLIIKYSCDGNEKSGAFLSEKLETMRLLVPLLGKSYDLTVKGEATDFHKMLGSIYLQSRRDLLVDTLRTYGADSNLGTFELKRYGKDIGGNVAGDDKDQLDQILSWARFRYKK